jgi:hypothetical protein
VEPCAKTSLLPEKEDWKERRSCGNVHDCALALSGTLARLLRFAEAEDTGVILSSCQNRQRAQCMRSAVGNSPNAVLKTPFNFVGNLGYERADKRF